MTSVVRINQNDQGLIYRTLDRGAQGIVVPHVNTKEEAQNLVDGGKFAPIGYRGMYTSRQGFGVPDYLQIANDETLLIILIEDIVAVRNLDEILTVDHIDVFFVAPSDLATSMGHIGDLQHPDVQSTIDESISPPDPKTGRVVHARPTMKPPAMRSTVRGGVRFLFHQCWLGGCTAGAAPEFVAASEEANNVSPEKGAKR